MKLFLSGPMTGIEDYNYPAFNAAAQRLRDRGFVVYNPAENQRPATETWGEYMRLSVRQLTYCDAIVQLPGWENSRGANCELQAAMWFGLTTIITSTTLVTTQKTRLI